MCHSVWFVLSCQTSGFSRKGGHVCVHYVFKRFVVEFKNSLATAMMTMRPRQLLTFGIWRRSYRGRRDDMQNLEEAVRNVQCCLITTHPPQCLYSQSIIAYCLQFCNALGFPKAGEFDAVRTAQVIADRRSYWSSTSNLVKATIVEVMVSMLDSPHYLPLFIRKSVFACRTCFELTYTKVDKPALLITFAIGVARSRSTALCHKRTAPTPV